MSFTSKRDSGTIPAPKIRPVGVARDSMNAPGDGTIARAVNHELHHPRSASHAADAVTNAGIGGPPSDPGFRPLPKP